MTSGTSAGQGVRRILDDMTTLTSSKIGPTPRARAARFLHTRSGRFLTAYLEMTVAMFVGMAGLGVVWDEVWPALADDLVRHPDGMALTMAFDMTAAMAAWMWVRRHSRRHILEMSAVMVLPFLVLLLPFHLGLLPGDAVLTWGHIAMFVLMAAYLWVRPHTGGAHAATTTSLAPAAQQPGRRHGRLAAGLLVGGAVLALVGGMLHPHTESPNAHVAVFAEYAHSSDWVWVHDLQFLSAAVLVAGFVVLGGALRRAGALSTVLRLGNTAAAATVSLIAANMAVDGVALKGAVDAWARAAADDKPARFAAAEAVRWLEWGVNSFFTVLLGLTVVVFAFALLQCAQRGHGGAAVRLAGVSGMLAGALLVMSGLAVGSRGFEASALPQVAIALYVVMALGLPSLDRAARRTAGAAAVVSSGDAR